MHEGGRLIFMMEGQASEWSRKCNSKNLMAARRIWIWILIFGGLRVHKHELRNLLKDQMKQWIQWTELAC